MNITGKLAGAKEGPSLKAHSPSGKLIQHVVYYIRYRSEKQATCMSFGTEHMLESTININTYINYESEKRKHAVSSA